ncbi:MAG: alternative ribosome rescue aminoacyl-tRNA hydrolase ArfB [bacterium]|jgi:ribosome-associated protein|nr:alternative ribosome rescue aminoacyl-tRNA hydrolase ArfB [bacterium]
MIQITERLSIPEHEITFTASRSGGPGGQHVNKVSSRVILYFDVAASPGLSDKQKQRILARLGTRISKNSVLRVVTQKHRSQTANRKLASERFAALLRDALAPVTVRRQTTIPKAVKRQRLEGKKRRSQLKQQRAQKAEWQDA